MKLKIVSAVGGHGQDLFPGTDERQQRCSCRIPILSDALPSCLVEVGIIPLKRILATIKSQRKPRTPQALATVAASRWIWEHSSRVGARTTASTQGVARRVSGFWRVLAVAGMHLGMAWYLHVYARLGSRLQKIRDDEMQSRVGVEAPKESEGPSGCTPCSRTPITT